MKKKSKLKINRPSAYTAELANAICRELAAGRTLRAVCNDPGMPSAGDVRRWASDDVQGFAAKYARARDFGYLALADEIISIADDSSNDWTEREVGGKQKIALNSEHVQRSKLRVSARQWLLAKILPKRDGPPGGKSGNIVVNIVRYGDDPHS